MAEATSTADEADLIVFANLTLQYHIQAQVDTWAGSHRSVRHFWGFTERQDLNQSCTDVSAEDLMVLVQTCKSGAGFDTSVAGHVRRYYGFGEGLVDHQEEPGWVCAQRRVGPLLGWLQAQYGGGSNAEEEDPLPDLLVYLDDDTFVDVDQARRFMAHEAAYAGGRPLARAACVIREDRDSEVAFSFPYGGFGTFLDKNALRDMLRPVKCAANQGTSAFDERVCSALEEDRAGERGLFEEGMTILELFYKYSSLPVYCLHSDWVIGYMVKYYLYGARSQESGAALLGMETYPFCGNITSAKTKRPCKETSATCHNMKPEDMEFLALSSYVRAPDSFNSLPRLATSTMTAVTDMITKKKAVQKARSAMPLPNVQLIGAHKAGTESVSAYDSTYSMH